MFFNRWLLLFIIDLSFPSTYLTSYKMCNVCTIQTMYSWKIWVHSVWQCLDLWKLFYYIYKILFHRMWCPKIYPKSIELQWQISCQQVRRNYDLLCSLPYLRSQLSHMAIDTWGVFSRKQDAHLKLLNTFPHGQRPKSPIHWPNTAAIVNMLLRLIRCSWSFENPTSEVPTLV